MTELIINFYISSQRKECIECVHAAWADGRGRAMGLKFLFRLLTIDLPNSFRIERLLRYIFFFLCFWSGLIQFEWKFLWYKK